MLDEEQKEHYLTHCWGDKRVDAFFKNICVNFNPIVWQECELTMLQFSMLATIPQEFPINKRCGQKASRQDYSIF